MSRKADLVLFTWCCVPRWWWACRWAPLSGSSCGKTPGSHCWDQCCSLQSPGHFIRQALYILTKDSTDLEWVDGKGGQVGDIVAGLGGVGGDHLVMAPVRLLALPDVDDVVADLWEVDMQRRGPGELHTPRVKLHDERLAWSAGDVWNVHSVRKKPWWRFANLRVSLLN